MMESHRGMGGATASSLRRTGERPTIIGSAIASVILCLGLAYPVVAQSPPDASLGKPTPKGGKIEATKGQPITITMASEAKTRASVVEFLIRDFPLNGKLGNVISLPPDRTKASVTYTPFADTAATVDSFTFAVRYPGGLWSNKTKVEIELKASEPVISATPEADFGRVMLGDSGEAEIFLSNSGNAAYRNQLQLPFPWAFIDPPNGLINLPVGGQQVVKVRFAPQNEGPAEFTLNFFRNRGSATQLKGAGYAPFTVGSEGVLLKWEEKSRSRIGELEVTNHSPELLPIALEIDERLKVTGEGGMFIPPNETANLQLYLPPNDPALYTGTLNLKTGAFSIPVPISADLAPGYLVASNTGTGDLSLDFGVMKPGDVSQGSFQLSNVGGGALKVRMITEAPFTVLAAGGRATLDPQEAEAFAVRATAPEGIPGPYEGRLEVEGDNGQRLAIVLKAIFLGPDTSENTAMSQAATAPSAGEPNPDRLPSPGGTLPEDPGGLPEVSASDRQRAVAEMAAQQSPLGFVTRPLIDRKIAQWVPSIRGETLSLVEDGRRHLVLGWPAPGTGFDSFELEMRTMQQPDEESPPESVWAPYSDVRFSTSSGGGTIAEIRGLAPNYTYEFRLFTLGDNDQVSEPIAFAATTRMPYDWTWIYVTAGLVLLLLLGVGTWWWLDRSSQIPWRFPDFRGLKN